MNKESMSEKLICELCKQDNAIKPLLLCSACGLIMAYKQVLLAESKFPETAKEAKQIAERWEVGCE